METKAIKQGESKPREGRPNKEKNNSTLQGNG
jgi:hypothetical protein